MFQVLYECTETWPDEGPLRINTQLSGEIAVSPDVARRRANHFLTLDVGILIGAEDPVLVFGERPVWRLQANLYLPHMGRVAEVGVIEVDAVTGDIIRPSDEQIQQMQDRASDLATRFAPQTERGD